MVSGENLAFVGRKKEPINIHVCIHVYEGEKPELEENYRNK